MATLPKTDAEISLERLKELEELAELLEKQKDYWKKYIA